MNELLEKMTTYLQKKKKPYVKQIMTDLNIEEHEVYGIIELLKREGYLYDVIDGKVIKTKPIKESGIYTLLL